MLEIVDIQKWQYRTCAGSKIGFFEIAEIWGQPAESRCVHLASPFENHTTLNHSSCNHPACTSMSVDHYSQLGWAMWRDGNSSTPEPGEDDYEESPYVREPCPMLPSFVSNLEEEELRTLHRWHTQGNLDDNEKASDCRQKANPLRAQARELDAAAERHLDRAMQGEAILRDLEQHIEIICRKQSAVVKRKHVSHAVHPESKPYS